LDEAIATGFRNPFRFSIEPKVTGGFELYVGDVGQNSIEEIDLISSTQLGGNYGWRHKEGSLFFIFNNGAPFVSDVPPVGATIPNNLIDPIAEYDHDEGFSVIGGAQYRGQAIEGLNGKYVFADYSRRLESPNGRLFYLDDDQQIKEFRLREQPPYYFTGVSRIGDELYLLGNQSLSVNSNSGVLLKLRAPEREDEFCWAITALNNGVAVVCL